MFCINRNEKVTCENCLTQTIQQKIVRHKTRCSTRTLYCTQCHNLSSNSHAVFNFNFAEERSARRPDVSVKCKHFNHDFSGFRALQQHKNTQHGFPT